MRNPMHCPRCTYDPRDGGGLQVAALISDEDACPILWCPACRAWWALRCDACAAPLFLGRTQDGYWQEPVCIVCYGQGITTNG